jgi:hypothetical protein
MAGNHPEGLPPMQSTLLSLFSQIADPRRGQGKMYPLAPILLFTVLAMLAGARSYRQVHAFIQAHLGRLNDGFGLSLRRAPAYSSVRFILHGLDAEPLERVFREHAAGLVDFPAQDAASRRRWPSMAKRCAAASMPSTTARRRMC